MCTLCGDLSHSPSEMAMRLNDLTPASLDAAAPALDDDAVTMVNLLWFNDEATYPSGFEGAKPDARSAYYQGYADAFNAIAADLGVSGVELVLRAGRIAGLVAEPDEDWDDMVAVRYRSLADFRRIVESDSYKRLADPHRRAAIANWRLIATRAG